ncbi:MAG TPA: outer membrane beta-barrel protein [Bacteroidales bacterium]|nr:outer membrane beta-barrel protein [Bacteroidales bacterium]
MKKLSIILLLSVISMFTISAQAPLSNGKAQLNAGVGFSGWGIPLYVGMDFGISRDITLGFEGSFRQYKEKYIDVRYNSTILGISGNGNYHFNRVLNIPSNWDFYAGLNIGFYAWTSPDGYPGDGNSGLGLGLQIGGRYFVSNNFGLNLEVGGGNAFSGGKFGITYIF